MRGGFSRRIGVRFPIVVARLSGFALGYPLAALGPHFVRRLPRALTLPDATPILTLTDSNLTLPSLRGNGIAISSAP